MRSISLLLTTRALVFAWMGLDTFAQPAPSPSSEPPAGYWEGAINLPATDLAIRVDFERTGDGAWSGSIDIPAQLLRGLALSDIEVRGSQVRFAMAGIPGSPAFEGKLNEAANAIAGDFTQSGQTFNFILERKARPERTGETPAKGVPGTGFAGVWQGSLRANAFELRLLLKLTNAPSGDGLAGTVDSIDQNAKGIPLTGVTAAGNQLHLEVKSIAGTYDGKLNSGGSEIDGDWKQGGQSLPLTFKRLDSIPDLSRAQDPKKPYPYLEEEVLFENPASNIKLAGTFTHPKATGPHPAAILLTGSGPQDRDEAIMGHRPFLVLADHLTRNGIAVLRYDDRGVGKSQGNFANATGADFTSDALAALAYLRNRPEADPERIGFIGHSEGGILAPRAAVQEDGVAFIVLLAGVGVPVEELLLRQAEDVARVMGAGEETIARQREMQQNLFRILKGAESVADAEAKARALLKQSMEKHSEEELRKAGISEALIEGQIRMMFTPWFREFLALDPRPVLEQVKCPVLALNGEKDVQVSAGENLRGIEEALRKGGNNDVTALELPGLNHLFQTCQTGAVAEYGRIEETFAPAALELISSWIRERTAR